MKANSIDLLFEEAEDDQSIQKFGSKESVESQSLVALLSEDDSKQDSKGYNRDNIQSPTSVSEKLKTLLHLIPPTNVQRSQTFTKASTLPDSGLTSSKTNSPMMQSYSESASLQSLLRNSCSDIESLQDTTLDDNGCYQTPINENDNSDAAQKFKGKEGSNFSCDKSMDNFIPKHHKASHISDISQSRGNNDTVMLNNGDYSDDMEKKANSNFNSQCDKAFHESKTQTLFRELSLNGSRSPFLEDNVSAQYLTKSRSLDFAQAPDDIQCTQVCSSSETFTALKTKLQAYRDFLLKRKSRSSTCKNKDLQRSNSLTLFRQDSDTCWKRTSSLENKHLNTIVKGKCASISSSDSSDKSKALSEAIHKQSLMMQGISSQSNSVLRPRTTLNKVSF